MLKFYRSVPFILNGTSSSELRVDKSPSMFNPVEAVSVVQYVTKLTATGVAEDDIGVISPYNGQVGKIKESLQTPGFSSVSVGTVEKFQGREKMVIIISTVRTHPSSFLPDGMYMWGFLDNPRRFNVATTMSRALLIVIGNPFILKQVHHLAPSLI